MTDDTSERERKEAKENLAKESEEVTMAPETSLEAPNPEEREMTETINIGADGKIPMPKSSGLPPELPEVIGNYRIIEQVGKGAMGVVFKAQHTVLNRKVALKIMKDDLARDPNFVSRFLREARLAATVESRHVVTVYDASTEQNILFIAMKFINGGELEDLLKTCGGRVPIAAAIRILIDCLKGLDDIHEAGLVHRDIKTANILLDKKGSAFLADLGLARAVEQADNLTMTGQAMGTPYYMSPEQAKAEDKIDIRSDIYALGVTLFKMLTGKTPFKGSSTYDTIAKILYEPAPDPKEFRPELDDDLIAIIKKAMAKKKEERYQSPREFLHAIEEYRKAHQIELEEGKEFISSGGDSSAIDVNFNPEIPKNVAGVKVDPNNVSEQSIGQTTGGTKKQPSSFFGKLTSFFKPTIPQAAPTSNKESSRYSKDNQSGSQSSSSSGSQSGAKKKKPRYYRGQKISDD